MTEKVINAYGIVPRDSATDGGFASLANQQYAKNKGIINIVFNKLVGILSKKFFGARLLTIFA